MRDGTWMKRTVQEVTARAFLDGEETDLDGYRLTSEMTASLAVVESDGSPVTTGSVEWPQQSVVSSSSPEPFSRATAWPPRQGSSLTIEVGDGGGQWWRQLTGYVDSTSGQLTSGSVSSAVVDLIDRLSRKVQRPPLLAAQPPNNPMPDGTPVDNYRRVQAYGVYVTDLAARTAGFWATPPRTSSTILSAPNMGSTWAEVGQVLSCTFYGVPGGPPQFRFAPWGAAVDHPDVWWQFSGGRPASAEVTVCLTATADARLDVVRQETGVGLYLEHRDVDDTVAVGSLVPAASELVSLPRLGCQRAAVAYSIRTTDQQLVVTLRMDDGREAIATSPVAAVWASSDAYPGCAHLYGAGAMGAVIVDQVYRSWEQLDAPVTAVIRPGRFTRLTAIPTLDGNDSALSILTAQARAECGSVWLDSDGVLHWVGRDQLEKAPAVAIMSTESTLDDLDWTDDLSGAREQVIVSHRAPAVKRYLDFSVDLVDPGSVTLNDGQVDEQWLDPGSDDWVQVDTALSYAGVGVRSVTAENSYYGGTVARNNTDNESQVWATAAQVSTTIEQVGYVYKLTRSASSIPAGWVLVTKVPPYEQGATSLFLAGKTLPLIRGKGLVSWVDAKTTYDTGIAAPTITYDHDVSWYVQDPADLDELGAWIVEKVANPLPRIRSVQVAFDPRLQLGDKVILTDPARTGLEVDLVVTRIDQDWSGGSPTMTLSGRITRVDRPVEIIDPAPRWQSLVDGWRNGL